MLEISKDLVSLKMEKNRGVTPLIVKAYEFGMLGLFTTWECVNDQVQWELQSLKPNNEKIPVLAEIWGQMLKLNNNNKNRESDELLDRIVKMCLVTRNKKIDNNIDEGLSELAKVIAEHDVGNIGRNFPLFDLFTDIKVRNIAVCFNKKMN